MEENQHHQLLLHHHHRRPPLQSRHTGMKGAGEIVEVQGGHIVRSIGRKDRHSKVCTAKGTRDRRVRLAAHTAIQFYDVQDRLGYDRPSKAVDWLMKNAKAAIDELDELPAWHPTASNPPPPPNQQEVHADNEPPASAAYGLGGGGGIGFLPPSLDSEAIADTIKSFFPMAAASTASSSSHPIDYRNYHPAQDLRLSLQSFQDPILLHHHHQNQIHTASGEQTFFPSSAALAFDANSASWSEQNQRMVPWNVAEIGGGGGGGYVFNLLPPQAAAAPPHNVLGQNQFFTQRGPLQSSNTPSFRAWMDPIAAAAEHQMHTGLHPSVSAFGFASGGFSGFRVPARIQGEEEHDGMNTKPTSASSSSQH